MTTEPVKPIQIRGYRYAGQTYYTAQCLYCGNGYNSYLASKRYGISQGNKCLRQDLEEHLKRRHSQIPSATA